MEYWYRITIQYYQILNIMTKDQKIKELEAEIEALNDFILMRLGNKGIEEANREYAIQRTNKMLEIRTIADFEEALQKEKNVRYKYEHTNNKK